MVSVKFSNQTIMKIDTQGADFYLTVFRVKFAVYL